MRNRSTFVKIMAVSLAVIMLVGLLAGTLAMSVHAASSAEIQEIIDQLEEQSEEIAAEQESLAEQIANTDQLEADMIEQKALIDQEMTLKHQEIENTLATIDQYELLIAEKEAELDLAENNEEDLFLQYRDRIRSMEEYGSVTYWSIIFKASSFSDLLDRMDMIQEIARSDMAMMAELEAASEEIRSAQLALEEAQTLVEAEYAALSEQEAELAAKSAEAQALIDGYVEEGVLLQDIYDQYELQQEAVLMDLAANQEAYAQALAAEEAARIAAEEEARRQAEEEARQEQERLEQENQDQPGGNESVPDDPDDGSDAPSQDETQQEPQQPTPPVTDPNAPPLPSNVIADSAAPAGIGFMCPLGGYVLTSPFGWRIHPVYGYEKFHYGVDLAAGEGTPIYAAAGGTVTVATYEASAGNYVMISHSGGFATSYMHMTHYIVTPGQYVSQGQVIGYVGSTGLSTGAHLHFAVYYNGKFVNPMLYL